MFVTFDRSLIPNFAEFSNHLHSCEAQESAYALIEVAATWDEVRRSCEARNRATVRAL